MFQSGGGFVKPRYLVYQLLVSALWPCHAMNLLFSSKGIEDMSLSWLGLLINLTVELFSKGVTAEAVQANTN